MKKLTFFTIFLFFANLAISQELAGSIVVNDDSVRIAQLEGKYADLLLKFEELKRSYDELNIPSRDEINIISTDLETVASQAKALASQAKALQETVDILQRQDQFKLRWEEFKENMLAYLVFSDKLETQTRLMKATFTATILEEFIRKQSGFSDESEFLEKNFSTLVISEITNMLEDPITGARADAKEKTLKTVNTILNDPIFDLATGGIPYFSSIKAVTGSVLNLLYSNSITKNSFADQGKLEAFRDTVYAFILYSEALSRVSDTLSGERAKCLEIVDGVILAYRNYDKEIFDVLVRIAGISADPTANLDNLEKMTPEDKKKLLERIFKEIEKNATSEDTQLMDYHSIYFGENTQEIALVEKYYVLAVTELGDDLSNAANKYKAAIKNSGKSLEAMFNGKQPYSSLFNQVRLKEAASKIQKTVDSQIGKINEAWQVEFFEKSVVGYRKKIIISAK